jgi:uncharacterized membrane protein YozB (DUF420 family)
MTVSDLPHLNASLNALSTVLIVAGYVMVRRRRIAAHKACMLSATGVSAAFLVCYLVYHYTAGHTTFEGSAAAKAVYYPLLASHVLLAAATPVLVGLAVYRGLRGQIDRHRRIVKWTLPIWLYVSVTGVLVYLVLYHFSG